MDNKNTQPAAQGDLNFGQLIARIIGSTIGGGVPVGAFGGKKEIMAMYDPREKKMYHSGTFNGNAVTMAAGLATMTAYDEDAVAHVEALGDAYKAGVEDIYNRLGLGMQILGAGSLYNLLFTNKDVKNYRDVAAAHEELNKVLYLDLLTRGVFNAERGMFCMSTPMTMDDIGFALETLEAAMKDLLSAIEAEAPELIL